MKLCHDAGNVLDYENADPIADIKTCAAYVRAFNIKDHRNWRTGLEIPLTIENIFEPLVGRPTDPAQVDRLARRAREYVETVIRGLQA